VTIVDPSNIFYAPVIRFPVWEVWLRRFIHRWRPDILHAHRVNSAGWMGALSGFHPFVVTAWGSDLNDLDLQPRLSRPLAGLVVRSADLITASSKDLLHQAHLLGAKMDRCHRIQWGVDLKYFFPGNSPELRQQLDIGEGPVILSPRAIDLIYNIHILLVAMPAVLRQFPEAKLVLRDYNTNQSYKARLMNQIADLGIEHAIRWLGRISPWEANAAVYRMADIAVSIPFSEGMAVSVWEALACGLPVIASDLPSLREWIIPGENGLLVPVGDAEALGQAIVRLLGDIDMQNRFGERGVELARQNADHQAEMIKMEQLYQNLMPNKHTVIAG
jgi:glycosyltransferase involved in cell wall biosynthesis